MSRQRVRPSLIQMMTEPCPSCEGTGRVLWPDTVVRRIERVDPAGRHQGESRDIMSGCIPSVALYLLEEEPAFLQQLREKSGIDLDMRDDPLMRARRVPPAGLSGRPDVTSRYAVA